MSTKQEIMEELLITDREVTCNACGFSGTEKDFELKFVCNAFPANIDKTTRTLGKLFDMQFKFVPALVCPKCKMIPICFLPKLTIE